MSQTLATPPSTVVIDSAVLQRAHKQARLAQHSLLEQLEQITGQSQRQIIQAVATPFGMRVMSTADMMTLPAAFELLQLSKAMQKNCALLRQDEHALLGVISDPFDLDLQTWLSNHARLAGITTIDFVLALPTDIHAYLSKQEETVRAVDGLDQGQDEAKREGKMAAHLSFASVSEASSPAVKLVNSTLYDALKVGASDIHLESTAQGLAVKYRIDGVLDHATSVNGIEVAEQVVSRIKVLAELDIAERRVPQDGSFRVESGGREIDMRVSIMPSIHGEDAVIRVLDKRAMIEAYGSLTLEALGFDQESLVQLRVLAEEAYGMLLVTGPTGSGKTTTLYAALTEIHNGRDKIITIEDPVEYQLPGILQIPVNEKKGLTFAKGLRSILRHDPDKIMVGEIRDKETAEIAVQSALNWPLWYSPPCMPTMCLTCLAASRTWASTRMRLSLRLNGIWAQRLIRTNCPHCAQGCRIRRTAASLGPCAICNVKKYARSYQFMVGQGCGDCHGTGYKGTARDCGDFDL